MPTPCRGLCFICCRNCANAPSLGVLLLSLLPLLLPLLLRRSYRYISRRVWQQLPGHRDTVRRVSGHHRPEGERSSSSRGVRGGGGSVCCWEKERRPSRLLGAVEASAVALSSWSFLLAPRPRLIHACYEHTPSTYNARVCIPLSL